MTEVARSEPVRFRVTTTATGRRRTVLVVVYDRVEDMRRAATAGDGVDHSQAEAMCWSLGWEGTRPNHVPLVIRFHRGALYTEVIAHEATHAAASLIRADCMSWDSRARRYLHAGYEPLAYAVGELTQQIVSRCFRLRLLTA